MRRIATDRPATDVEVVRVIMVLVRCSFWLARLAGAGDLFAMALVAALRP
jgi:hypothetical protein